MSTAISQNLVASPLDKIAIVNHTRVLPKITELALQNYRIGIAKLPNWHCKITELALPDRTPFSFMTKLFSFIKPVITPKSENACPKPLTSGFSFFCSFTRSKMECVKGVAFFGQFERFDNTLSLKMLKESD